MPRLPRITRPLLQFVGGQAVDTSKMSIHPSLRNLVDHHSINASPEPSGESESEEEEEEQRRKPSPQKTRSQRVVTQMARKDTQSKNKDSNADDTGMSDWNTDRLNGSQGRRIYGSSQSQRSAPLRNIRSGSQKSSAGSNGEGRNPSQNGTRFKAPSEPPKQARGPTPKFKPGNKESSSSPTENGDGGPRKRKRGSVDDGSVDAVKFIKPPLTTRPESGAPTARIQLPPDVKPALHTAAQFRVHPDALFQPPPGAHFNVPSIAKDIQEMPLSPQRLSSSPSPLIKVSSDEIQAPEEFTGPTCLICKSPIPAELFEMFLQNHGKSFLKGGSTDFYLAAASMRWPYQMQALLHRIHRQESASQEWVAKGYPQIDWESLSMRVARHKTELVKVLERKTPSEVRDRYEKRVAVDGHMPAAQAYLMPGRNKGMDGNAADDLLKGLTPGYYGLRGAQMILDELEDLLQAPLAKARKKDKLVGRATVTYLQEVMVPEVGWRLIMDDLGVDETEARKILKDSADIGMLVHSGEEALGTLEEEDLSEEDGDEDDEEEEEEEEECEDGDEEEAEAGSDDDRESGNELDVMV
ncbi:hypothetical protein P152DRAFT_451055 [Eremomyces bilateralis CBS 781.70]|uniref:Restriction of telomere capping protein 4 n=1 Tax=Eremomyces bilateralis CBS 781.70 TaxID=1392243 RepID=A0A6G1FYD2_9PEZI|nr:uncharacterized protein P152DRAFT_451055 [Eremomyces bilateralis CBS 781.70]KAF1810701.1 hypothetical protein P152DRAFT_451055 [Eremomyces bilateralis CBS 781.70]